MDQNDQNQIRQTRIQMIQIAVQTVSHASHCINNNCSYPKCGRMKRILTHTKICNTRIRGNCQICRHFVALCTYHAKNCTRARCCTPYCTSINNVLQSRQELRTLQNDQSSDEIGIRRSRLSQIRQLSQLPYTAEKRKEMLCILKSDRLLMNIYMGARRRQVQAQAEQNRRPVAG